MKWIYLSENIPVRDGIMPEFPGRIHPKIQECLKCGTPVIFG
jgi:hypothetical protein